MELFELMSERKHEQLVFWNDPDPGYRGIIAIHDTTMGPVLHQRGILYAPDYVINAGGLINVYGELNDWTADRSKWKAGEIYGTLLRIFELAKSDGIGPHLAANKVGEVRILEARYLQRTFRT